MLWNKPEIDKIISDQKGSESLKIRFGCIYVRCPNCKKSGYVDTRGFIEGLALGRFIGEFPERVFEVRNANCYCTNCGVGFRISNGNLYKSKVYLAWLRNSIIPSIFGFSGIALFFLAALNESFSNEVKDLLLIIGIVLMMLAGFLLIVNYKYPIFLMWAGEPNYRNQPKLNVLLDLRNINSSIESLKIAIPSEAWIQKIFANNIRNIKTPFGVLKPVVCPRTGKEIEYYTPVGRIDLLANDICGNYVIVEFKKGRTPDKVIGQTKRYMGWIDDNLAREKDVFGMIICENVDQKTIISIVCHKGY